MSLTLSAGNGGALLPTGYLSTQGSQIVDASGDPVRLASIGWNQGFDDIPDTVAAMKAAGFNTIRVSWVDATMASDLQLLDQVVAAAKANGLKVIIDNHTNEPGSSEADNYGAQQRNGLWYDVGGASDGTDGGGNAGTVTDARFQQDWVTVAAHFAGNDTVVGFDLRNEPLEVAGGSTWGDGNPATDIRLMYQRVGDAIQAVNPGALIIAEGPQNYSGNAAGTGTPAPWGDLSLAGSAPVTLSVPNKVVYSVHDYPQEISGVTPDSGAAKVAAMNADWGYLVSQNIAPVWVGEMGSSMQDPTDAAWAQTLLDYMNGAYAAEGGPAFSGNQQGVSGDWWAWGNLAGQYPNGTLNADGSLNASQAAVWTQLLFKATGAGAAVTGVAAAAGAAASSAASAVTGAGAGAAPPATGSGQIVLQVSGDALANGDGTSDAAGDPTFTVSVDGQQVGGTFTATAPHAAGAPQAIDLPGNFASGTHTVAVTFTNDAMGYGGDRNLYVDGITVQGQATGQSAALLSNGTQMFTVTGGATAAAASSGSSSAASSGASSATSSASGATPRISVTPAGGTAHRISGTTTGTVAYNGDTYTMTAPGVADVVLGDSSESLRFVGMSSVALTGGAGAASVTADGGTNSFAAGSGGLTVTGGAGADAYWVPGGSGGLTVRDFSAAKGDTLTIDAGLQGMAQIGSDGQGGTAISFGGAAGVVDLRSVASLASSDIRWA